jgi:hypothetical protein
MAQRTYSRVQGTIDMLEVFGCNRDRDEQLKNLVNPDTGATYTRASVKDKFPAFGLMTEAYGWTDAEVLNVYEVEAAHLQALWDNDTYIHYGAVYTRPGRITQSRAWIKWPDGRFRVAYGCDTGLGRYSGKHANNYGESTGGNKGSTPGTCLVVDHANWMTARRPNRNPMPASAWGADFGQVGGLAYSEGVIIEGFRFEGGMEGKVKDPTFESYGATLSHPGENSAIRYCMSSGFNSGGYAVLGGTPGLVDVCSAFYNLGPGFDMLGNNGLTNMTMNIPSGDNNAGALIRIRPLDAGSVGGGTFLLNSPKEESRNLMQRLISVEGNLGQVSIVINGGTADYSGVTCDGLIRIEKGSGWQVEAHGIEFSSGVEALVHHVESGVKLTGGQAFRGNTFGVNNEGLYLKSRSNMVLSTGGVVVPPVDPGPVTPPTGTMTATASVNNVPAELAKITDGNANTFWLAGTSMAVGQWVQVDYGATASRSSVSFDIANGYTNSFPRTFDVQVSTNGTAWTTVKAGATGAYPTCSATFTATACRYVRVVVKTANPNWWGIAGWK